MVNNKHFVIFDKVYTCDLKTRAQSYKTCSCLTQLSMKFQPHIKNKMLKNKGFLL